MNALSFLTYIIFAFPMKQYLSLYNQRLGYLPAKFEKLVSKKIVVGLR